MESPICSQAEAVTFNIVTAPRRIFLRWIIAVDKNRAAQTVSQGLEKCPVRFLAEKVIVNQTWIYGLMQLATRYFTSVNGILFKKKKKANTNKLNKKLKLIHFSYLNWGLHLYLSRYNCLKWLTAPSSCESLKYQIPISTVCTENYFEIDRMFLSVSSLALMGLLSHRRTPVLSALPWLSLWFSCYYSSSH